MLRVTERLSERWKQTPSSDRRALTIGGIFLLVVFGYIGVIEPVLSRYENANNELAELQDRQVGNSRKIALLPKREARLVEYRAQRDALEQRFQLDVESVEQAVSRTIAEITYYARLSDVVVSGVRPQRELTLGDYTEIPFELNVRGDYISIRKFIYYVDTSPSVLAVARLQLKPSDDATLVADLQIIDVVRLGAGREDQSPARMAERNRLRLAIPDWPGYWPVWVAESEGYLDSGEFSFEFIDAQDKTTLERLMLSGQVDGLGLSFADLIAYWSKGIPLKIVQPVSHATGAEAIVVAADSGLKTLAGLQGQQVAVDEQGLLPYVFTQALQGVGLSVESVNTIPREASQVAREIRSGLLLAGVTREPWLSELIADGTAIELFRSDELPGNALDVLAIYSGGETDKSAAVQFLIDALHRAEQFIEQNRTEAIRLFASRTGTSIADAEHMLGRLSRFSGDQSQSFFSSTEISDRLSRFVQYYEQTDQPVPLLTAADIADASFVDAVRGSRSND